MSRSVSFQNPIYTTDSQDEVKIQPSPDKPTQDDSEYESDEYTDDDSFDGLDPLDFSKLNPYKFTNDQSLHRIGPVPIAESTEFISSSKQIAILAKNADGINFEVLRKNLSTGGQGVSRSACDALLSHFYELGNQGNGAKVDYHFLDNLLTGEGGKHGKVDYFRYCLDNL